MSTRDTEGSTPGPVNRLFTPEAIEKCVLTQEERHEVEAALGYAASDDRICGMANAYANWSVVQMELDSRTEPVGDQVSAVWARDEFSEEDGE